MKTYYKNIHRIGKITSEDENTVTVINFEILHAIVNIKEMIYNKDVFLRHFTEDINTWINGKQFKSYFDDLLRKYDIQLKNQQAMIDELRCKHKWTSPDLSDISMQVMEICSICGELKEEKACKHNWVIDCSLYSVHDEYNINRKICSKCGLQVTEQLPIGFMTFIPYDTGYDELIKNFKKNECKEHDWVADAKCYDSSNPAYFIQKKTCNKCGTIYNTAIHRINYGE